MFEMAFDDMTGGFRAGAMALCAAACLSCLSACGDKPADATQVAARVNKGDVTVHQINFLLQQNPAQADDAVGRQVLERLIDQELAVQKAMELKLDRDPRVVQSLEAARREVLARAYGDQVVQGIARPSADEVRQFYDAQPALFKDRRVYSLQELLVEAPLDKHVWVKERLAAAKTVKDFAESLKAEGLRFSGNQAIKPAEQLPIGLVERFAKMKDGESAVITEGGNLRVVFIGASRAEPVSFERASSSIEQFLANQARRKAVDENLKALRSAAQISYQGKFVGGPGAGASTAAPASAPNLPAMTTAPVQMQVPDASPDPVKLALPDAAPAPASAASANHSNP